MNNLFNFRSASGWTNPSTFNQTTPSYPYGYSAARGDLPQAGQDPVYSPNSWRNQLRAPHLQPQHYDPVYPDYSVVYDPSIYSKDSADSQYVKVASSTFSLRNSIEKGALKGGVTNTRNLRPIPSAGNKTAPNPTNPMGKQEGATTAEDASVIEAKPKRKKRTGGQASKTRGAVVNESNRKRDQNPPRSLMDRNFMQQIPMMRRGVQKRSYDRNGRPIIKASNKQTDIEFVPLPESVPAISVNIEPNNLHSFHGFDSVFSMQYKIPVLVDGLIYENADHYYQHMKVKDLTGQTSEKIMETVRDETGKRVDGKTGKRPKGSKGYKQIATEILILNKIDKEKVEEWRNTKGLAYISQAMLAKATQSLKFRQTLMDTGDKCIVHSYSGDCIYGTGCTIVAVKKWCEEMQTRGVTSIRVPASFPLDSVSVKSVPNFAKGRNILGVVLMQIRDMLKKNQISLVDLTNLFETIKKGNSEPMETTGNVDGDDGDGNTDGFQIGGGRVQAKIGATLG